MTVEWDLDPYPSNLELSKVVALKNPQVRVAMLSGFGHRIEFFQYYKPKGKPYPKNFRLCDCGITHIALEVTDIENHYEDLLHKGVKLNCPPQIVRNTAKVTYCPSRGMGEKPSPLGEDFSMPSAGTKSLFL